MLYDLEETPKALRETLCVAQTHVALSSMSEDQKQVHIDRLQRLINECDRHRPLGEDGTHGCLHTETCGCTYSDRLVRR